MPTAISLFSGCGGSDSGLSSAGFDILMANDVLAYAKHVHQENFPATDYILGDVREIKSFPSADLLVGCYPCQGFSQGGSREPSDARNLLYKEFNRALHEVKPKAFIVENVSGMLRADYEHLYQAQLSCFTEAGYQVKSAILKAENFGVAQARRRLFFVGIRSDIDAEYTFPSPTHDGTEMNPFATIKDAIGDLPLWPEGEYHTEAFHWYYLSRNRYRAWNDLAPTIVAHARHVSLHPVSPHLVRLGTDEWRFSEDRPARRFSYRECARLQGFAKNWTMPDTAPLREKYKVIGNAVPPPLFAAVAGALPEIW